MQAVKAATRPAAHSLQTPVPASQLRGNTDGSVAHIHHILGQAASSGEELRHQGGTRDPGDGAASYPKQIPLGGCRKGYLFGRDFLAKLNSEYSFRPPPPLYTYIEIIIWPICLSLAKLIFLLRNASWVIKAAQPMVSSARQVFIKPISGVVGGTMTRK